MSDREAVVAALFALGAEGVQDFDDAIVTHLRGTDDAAILSALRQADPTSAVALEPTPPADWSAEWKTQISAHRVGSLVVSPPWLASSYPSSDVIVIEPGMAFGTGEHETTRSAMRLMQRVVRQGDFVADLGTGSAVLAIAAAKLGAARVVGIEIDSDAIENAESNVENNDVADRVTILEGDAAALLPLIAPVRVILANIVSGVLLELLPLIASSLSTAGAAVLSGILLEERTMMERALSSNGWRTIAAETEGAWWSVAIQRA